MKEFITISKDVEGEIWLHFEGVNAIISLESIIKDSGPIVQRELRKWAKSITELLARREE